MAVSKQTSLHLKKNSNIKDEVASALALLEELSAKSSDSGLSEETCWELFGGPCPEGLKKKNRSLEKNEELEVDANEILSESKLFFTKSNENLEKEQEEDNEDKTDKAKTAKQGSFAKELKEKDGNLKEGSLTEGIPKETSLKESNKQPKSTIKEDKISQRSKISEESQLPGKIKLSQSDSLHNGQEGQLSKHGNSKYDKQRYKTSNESQLSGKIKSPQNYPLNNGQEKRLSKDENSKEDKPSQRSNISKESQLKEDVSTQRYRTSKESYLSEAVKTPQNYSLNNGYEKPLLKDGNSEQNPRKSAEFHKVVQNSNEMENKGNYKIQDRKRNSQESQKFKEYQNVDATNAGTIEILNEEKLISIEDLNDSLESDEEHFKFKAKQELPTTTSIGSGENSVTSRTTEISTSVSNISFPKKGTDTLSSSETSSSSSDDPRAKFDTSESSDLQACNCICCVERQIQKAHKKVLQCSCFKKEPVYCQCCNQPLSSSNKKLELKIYNEEGEIVSDEWNSGKQAVRIMTFDDDDPKSRSKKIQTSTVDTLNNNRRDLPCCCSPYDNNNLLLNPGYSRPVYSNKRRNFPPKENKKDCKCSGDFRPQLTKLRESSGSNNYYEDSETSSKSSWTTLANQQHHSNLADALKDTLLKRSVKETVKRFENNNNYSLQVYTESSDKDFYQSACKQNIKYKENPCQAIAKNKRCGCCCGEPKSILKRRPNVPMMVSNPCICNHGNCYQ